MLSNQEAQGAQLVRHEMLLSEIYVTLRSAAREQRQGRSMRFDEICATTAVRPCIPFPQARTERPATHTSSSSLGPENPSDASIAAHASTPDVRIHRQTLISVTRSKQERNDRVLCREEKDDRELGQSEEAYKSE